MTNIIQFPVKEELSDTDMEETVINDEMMIEDMGEYISEQMMTYLVTNGFEIGNEDFIDDFTFSIEAFKAAMYRCMHMDHPLHPHIDEFMCVLEEEEFD